MHKIQHDSWNIPCLCLRMKTKGEKCSCCNKTRQRVSPLHWRARRYYEEFFDIFDWQLNGRQQHFINIQCIDGEIKKGECCLKFNDPSLPMFDVVVAAITGISNIHLSDVSTKSEWERDSHEWVMIKYRFWWRRRNMPKCLTNYWWWFACICV